MVFVGSGTRSSPTLLRIRIQGNYPDPADPDRNTAFEETFFSWSLRDIKSCEPTLKGPTSQKTSKFRQNNKNGGQFILTTFKF